MTPVDVAVVGGGLAGCAAAIELARAGFSVSLFESGRYPQHKVCGEVISPEGVLALAELGVMPRLLPHGPTVLETVEVTTPAGATWTTRLPGQGMGVSRYLLDAALADQARAVGAGVAEGATVTDLQGDLAGGFNLRVRLGRHTQVVAARAVIAAHGKRSPLDRALRRRFLRVRQPFVGLKAHFVGPLLPRRVDMHTFDGGYCGLSEIEGGLVNVCLLVRQPVFARASGGDIITFVRWMRAQNPRLDSWMEHAQQMSPRWLSIAQVPFLDKDIVVNDILMAGDSAGLIAPLAGDGMSMALDAGRLAARHVSAFLRHSLSAADLRAAYRREWTAAFRGRLRLGRWLQAFMLRPALLQPGLGLVRVVPALGDFFVTHTRNVSSVS